MAVRTGASIVVQAARRVQASGLILRAHHDVPRLDTPREHETIRHVRIAIRESRRDVRRVCAKDEERPVWWIADGTRHHDLSSRLGLANQIEVIRSKRRPPIHVVVNDRVISQDKVRHASLYSRRRCHGAMSVTALRAATALW